MPDTILYLETEDGVDTADISAVICKNRSVANAHKDACFATNTAVLVENDIDAYKELNLDGVYFDAEIPTKTIKETRKAFPNIQMGLDCLDSRHRAMVAGESGIDFVMFSGDTVAVTELVNCWTDIMEIAVVANGRTVTFDPAIENADFVLLDASK